MALDTAPPDQGTSSDDLGFDPDALRAKYLAERDKRLRADGSAQYREMKGEFAHYLEDPYVEPGYARAPITDEAEVVVIGGGFGGLLAGARLREAGVDDIRLIEKGGDFGGTWYWNRYPGAACDVESYIYLPLLEETGYIPVEKYSRAPEILRHSRAIGEHFDLYRGAIFQTEVKELRWDEAAKRWIVKTNRDDAIRAKFVVMASGPMNRPKLPGIPGVETFKGHSFHTSRWDYGYTGGDSSGGLAGLKDKVVGIIGTGATAVQCIPHLGASAKHLYVFQRTPSSIDVRANRPTDPEWAASLAPGWQKHRMENFNALVTGGFAEEDLVGDGWTSIIGNVIQLMKKGAGSIRTAEDMARTMQLADFQKMEQVRQRVDQVVKDQAAAEALKPWYNQFCKRPCFHDEYLETFNRPNVTLVDTDGKGVDQITESSVIANGKTYEVDCLVYATGFEVGTGYTRRSGFEAYGRGGLTLTEKWSNGIATLHGMHARGFPNCFIMTQSQSGFTVNFPHMIDEQSKHLAYIVAEATTRQLKAIEASQAAEDAWVQVIVETGMAQQRPASATPVNSPTVACTPGYLNNEGQSNPLAFRMMSYAKGPVAFIKLLEAWRAKGELEGLELTDA